MKRLLFVLFCISTLAGTDLKVRTEVRKISSASQGVLAPQQTIYTHGAVERAEFVGYVTDYGGVVNPADFGPKNHPVPHMAVITHCDTRIVHQIDLDNHEYRETKVPRYLSKREFEEQVEEARKEAETRTKSNTVDTGETQDFYGHKARHLITTISEKSAYTRSEETVDGWYLDMPQPGCAPEYMRWGKGVSLRLASFDGPDYGGLRLAAGGDRLESLPESSSRSLDPNRIIYTGFVPGGLAISSKSSIHQVVISGGRKFESDVSIYRSVLEFSQEPLDLSLFEVPAGFTKVKQLYQHMKTARK
jgi:hypothetical protein